MDDDNLLELTASNLPKSTNVIWVSENRQVPIVRIKYAFADIIHGRGDYTKTGVIEKVTAPDDVEHEFVNLIKPFLAQLPILPDVKSKWKAYAKEHGIEKDNMDSIISFVYYFYRHASFGTLTGANALNTEFENYYDCRQSQSRLKQLELSLKVMKTVNQLFDANAELVLASAKNEVEYKNIFAISDFNYLLRLPGANGKFAFYYFESNLYNFNEIPAVFENETYKYIQQNSIFRKGGDMSQAKADMVNGKATASKTSPAENNQTEDLVIELDNTNMQLLHVKRKARAAGHQRRSMQASTLILEDYLIAERKLLDMETDLKEEWLSGDRYYRKFWVDAEQSINKAKKEQKEKFVGEVKYEYVDKPTELKSYKVLQNGFSGTNAPMVIVEEFSMDGWVKKAGNNYIVEAGRFAGEQLEVKADQRERKLDIYMPYARSFNNNIRLKIPEGYTAEGLEKLNKSVKNECGGFESTAKIEGNDLVITYSKYYTNAVEPAANWGKILAFVDAGFAFTKEKILLKKK